MFRLVYLCYYNHWIKLCRLLTVWTTWWIGETCCLSSFRLKSLTTETAVVVSALQKSKTGLLELSEDKTKIRRSPEKPLPELNDEYKDAVKHRSVYIVSFKHVIIYSSEYTIELQLLHFFAIIQRWTLFPRLVRVCYGILGHSRYPPYSPFLSLGYDVTITITKLQETSCHNGANSIWTVECW